MANAVDEKRFTGVTVSAAQRAEAGISGDQAEATYFDGAAHNDEKVAEGSEFYMAIGDIVSGVLTLVYAGDDLDVVSGDVSDIPTVALGA